MLSRQWCFALATLLLAAPVARAQIDPEKRRLLQVGYNQPLEGRGPIAGYAYLYWNEPGFLQHSNLTLRLAIAPVYVDSEAGFKGLLGEQTDVAFGLGGGGFVDTYSEVRQGQYLKSESFTGHGAEGSISLYHLFNPGRLVPLNLILRCLVHYSNYSRDDDTAQGFILPEDRTALSLRAGLRFGGREPLIFPSLALELSVWYEAMIRNEYGAYGFAGDRAVEPNSHLFWGRALLVYTFPEMRHNFSLNLTLGTTVNADRFSAYRLGSALPLASEFPLNLPGYYFQEISASQFMLISGQYLLPLDTRRRWNLTAFAATAVVDYLPGLEQPGNWLSGVGGGLVYTAPSGVWQASVGYAYGIDALRSHGRGANSIGFLLQFDLEAQLKRGPLLDPSSILDRLRGLERLFGR